MKWFKHHTDAHNNLKFQKIFNEFGSEGYGLFWVCVELVGREGENFRISTKKDWISYLVKNSTIPQDKLKKILTAFGEIGLVDKKALNKGELYLPKLQERVDEYTDKVGRKSRQDRESVGKEEKRTEQIRKEEMLISQLKSWNETQSSPLQAFIPENIVRKHGVEKVGALIKKYGEQNKGGFSVFLNSLKE